jgi:ligand-binding sensor domain-containing protein
MHPRGSWGAGGAPPTLRLLRVPAAALFGCALTSAPPAWALDPTKAITQYSQDAWSTADGLPQGAIQAIAQTRDGYLWFGTRSGPARFNGVAFTAFDAENGIRLGDMDVRSLRAANDGSLWLGTDGKGFLRFRDGSFAAVPGFADDSGNQILEDRDGVAWFATWAGLVRFDGTKGRRITLQDGLPHDSVFAVVGTEDGAVWAATTSGLAELRGGRVVGTRKDLSGQPHCLLVDRRRALWVGTTGGLDRLADGHVTHFTESDGLLGSQVNALAEDRDGNLWIGTDAGLSRLHEGRFDAYTVADGLPGSSVVSLLEDREGSLWIGLLGNGLVRLRDGIVTTYARREGLPEDHVTCVLESRDGSLWIGTSRGLARYHRGSFRIYGKKDGLLNASILGLWERRSGEIAIATYSPQLNLIKADRVTVLGPLKIEGSVPAVLIEDRLGALWVGTRGLGLFHVQGEKVDHYPFAEPAGAGVIHAAIEDSKGILWFGTANGLTRYEHGKFSKIAVYGQGGVIFSIHEDGRGTLWIGTRDNGICRFRDGHTLRCYSKADGLFDNAVYQVLEDDRGLLWMGGPRGISSVAMKDLDDLDAGRLENLTSEHYGIADGMKSTQCEVRVSPAGVRSTDGRLWFPTTKGLVSVDPDKPRARALVPPVIIERALVNGRPLPPGGVAPPGHGAIDLSYAVLTYLAPRRVRSRYRLEGFDPDWIDAGGKREAHYTNLPPGEYRFRVVAGYEGVWNEEGAVVAIRLEPHFYETRWWHALVIAVFASLAWAAYRARTHQLRARQIELSTKIREALASVRTLRGLLPMCAWCKKVRDDKGYWEQIEAYVKGHSEADITHGICPDCAEKLRSQRPGPPSGSTGG